MIFLTKLSLFSAAQLSKLEMLLPPSWTVQLSAVTHAPTKAQSLLGRALLGFALRRQGIFDLPALAVTARGKPFFSNASLCFSISHSGDWVVLAVSEAPVGVDVETVKLPSDAVLRRVLTDDERDVLAAAVDPAAVFAFFWTAKESYLKLTGEGLSGGLQSLSFAPFAFQASFQMQGIHFSAFSLEGAALTVCGREERHSLQFISAEELWQSFHP